MAERLVATVGAGLAGQAVMGDDAHLERAVRLVLRLPARDWPAVHEVAAAWLARFFEPVEPGCALRATARIVAAYERIRKEAS